MKAAPAIDGFILSGRAIFCRREVVQKASFSGLCADEFWNR
jgi:hypothetical protein